MVDYLVLSLEEVPGVWEHCVLDLLKVGGDWAEQSFPGLKAILSKFAVRPSAMA